MFQSIYNSSGRKGKILLIRFGGERDEVWWEVSVIWEEGRMVDQGRSGGVKLPVFKKTFVLVSTLPIISILFLRDVLLSAS